MPSILPLQLRQHDADRACRARRGRDEVDRRSPCAPQVLVRQVERALIVRVRVDRRHETALDRVRLVQELRERRDAVRRARRVRDDRVLLRVVILVVHAEDDRHVRVRCRCGDDDLLRAGIEVLLGALALREEAGRLDRDVDAELAPRQVGRVALGEELDLVVADAQHAVAHLDRYIEVAERRVVPQQVRHRLQVAEVVRRDDLEVAAVLEMRAEEVPSDPPEAVDAHPDLRHGFRVAFRSRFRRESSQGRIADPSFEKAAQRRAGGEAPRTTLPSGVPHPRPWRRTGSESAAGRARTRRCRV